MMVLILVLSTVACVIFVRTYRKEMREKEERKRAKLKQQAESAGEKEVSQ
jgi:positive regulator of sigma E activity